MPQVPVYKPSAQTVAIQTPLLPHATFGIEGRQTAALGQGISRASDATASIALDLQERENVDAVVSAEASLKSEELDFHNSVKERLGRNAEGVSREATQWWTEAERRHSETLNEPQKKAFDKIAMQRRNASLRFTSGYEASEMRKAREEAANASVAGSVEAGIAAAYDQETIDLNKGSIQKTIAATAKTNGWSPEVKDLKTAEALTAMHTGVINSRIEQSPSLARQYYNANKKEINGSARARIEKNLKTAGTREASQAKADKIYSPDKTDKAMRAEAREISKKASAEVRDATLTRINARIAEDKAADIQIKNEAADEAWKTAIATEDPFKIPDNVWNTMDGTDQARVLGWIEQRKANAVKPRVEDDWNALDSVETMIEEGDVTDPNQLIQYEPYFTKSTYGALRKKVQKRDEIGATELKESFELRKGGTRKDNAAEWLEYEKYILNNVKETKRPEDLDVWADRWFMAGQAKKTSLFVNDPDTYGEAVIAGREDEFLIATPDDDADMVRESIGYLERNLENVETGAVAQDEFYTRYYLDASRWLRAHESTVTPQLSAAYAYLRAKGKPITPANINYVAERLK